ncbi:hypothetical protein CKO35_04730 [Ectothiorhodospira shaposhnikovii]|uniref:hypothetical protein n=1 Tax=Ectothiorhodospira shaposhnikovii TaxID=1054 RepID=UPI00190303C4|nr:hypothetical protein [Ectothiorhodospira shaposhnikovii]MBK1672613.1 hypothetical protein [Ectothiorhodospira shaposhnikovii]
MQKKILAAAVASSLVAMGSAHAVEKAETGNMLLVPYYTTEAGNETYINIVNTTTDFKAVKIRFREAKGSEDSLDFHVYMSPKDVWSAALTQKADGTPVLVTGDTSCTWGRVGSTAASSGATVKTTYLDEIVALLDADVYEGGDPAARIREGYVEIIEMATLAKTTAMDGITSQLSYYAKHVDGVPRNCDVFRDLNQQLPTLRPNNYVGTLASATSATVADVDLSAQFEPPSGGLFGSAAIINVDDATYIPMDRHDGAAESEFG